MVTILCQRLITAFTSLDAPRPGRVRYLKVAVASVYDHLALVTYLMISMRSSIGVLQIIVEICFLDGRQERSLSGDNS